jgi:hypothetical protein
VIWTPAFFGLLGVIVGGIITAGSNYLLDRRRERAINQRDNRNYAIEIKRAARLIDAELLRARGAARMVIKDKRWWIPDTKLKTEAWEKYSAVLAPVLSYSDWVAVMKGVLAIDDIHLEHLTYDLADSTVEKLVPMLADIETELSALAPYVLDALPEPLESMVQRTRG